MDYVANQEEQIKEMLRAIGVDNIEALYAAIPPQIRLPFPREDDGFSEYEGRCWMEELAAKNRFSQYENYLGAGCYEHQIPALTVALCNKSEFLTSYTPYQPEASQGLLQATFEYQSAVCALTGMEVSNASLYDGASACAEGVLMGLRVNRDRKKIVISSALHPHYKEVVKQYVAAQELEWVESDVRTMAERLDTGVAALLVQSPNFFGIVEDLTDLFSRAKELEVISILCANPLSYGLFSSAGELGADIAVGDCQPFGVPMHFGGPGVGYIACKKSLVRQLPGRLVAETTDTQGRRGFVLTLQAREQHIRREKATSNICTNQALAALASLITLLWYGKQGIKEVALANYQRAAYLRERLAQQANCALFDQRTVFNEFAVRFPAPAENVQKHFREQGIEPGLHLGRYFPEWQDYFLVAVTETKSRSQLDRYIEAAKKM